VIRFIYNLLWPLGLIFFLPRYFVKMFRRGGYREKFGQRLGIYNADVRRRLAARRSTWLHAVSVGEVAVALKLAEQLQLLQPDLHCVLTVTTTTGFSFAKAQTPRSIEIMYTPLDFWPIMRRAFAVIRPAKIILVEAEIWPNLAAEAHARGIPLALVNARLSPRSEKRFRRFRFFVRPTFRLLDLTCVQEPDDINRWAELGVERDRIRHVGSIKYDPAQAQVDSAASAKLLHELKIDINRPIIFGGSTHRGEEEALAKIFRALRIEFPNLFLIIASRHVERAGEVRRNLERIGLRVALRSEPWTDVSPDCLLIDSTGELRAWYPVATIIFVGKSLFAFGGQNPAEAIVADKPVVFGPHMENFAALTESLIARRGAVRVHSATELEQAIVDLLRNTELRRTLVNNAHQVLDTHRGATARTAQLVVDLA
jgi:3-deoxy-D-manno-octulosonic-acid transferase